MCDFVLHRRRVRFKNPPVKRKRGKHTNAWVAQLVEQLAFNQLVLGSNPSPRILTFNKESHFGVTPFVLSVTYLR